LKIDSRKLEIRLAEQCKTATDLRESLSPATITRIRQGRDVGTKTVGKLARALGVEVTELLEAQA
jgi:DNA-binding Xre family transcriptional regulator